MSMKVITFAATMLCLIAGTARSGNFAIWGNDSGGIIPWSPAVDDVYREVANEHCAIYKKIAHIISVRHDYGEFISFACVNSNLDPIKGSAFR
jgi:hypothetical protein